MKSLPRLAAAFAAMTFSFAVPVAAQDVTLTSRDGGLALSGTLQSFDGEIYRVDTAYGVLTLDAQGVVCDGPGCPDLTAHIATLDFAGSRLTGERLLPALVEAFARQRGLAIRREIRGDADFRYTLSRPDSGQPMARVGFRLTDSGSGLRELIDGAADVALSSFPLRGTQAHARARLIALDAFVPLVAGENPLSAISPGDMARLLSGEVTDWSALGFAEGPVRLHALDAAEAFQQALEERLLDGKPAAAGVTRHATLAELAEAVADDPLAFGIGAASGTGAARVLPLRGDCGLWSEATPFAIRAGDYPLAIPLIAYTPRARMSHFARDFLDWLTTPAAARVIAREGFTDRIPDREAVDRQGGRLARAVGMAGGDMKPELTLGEIKRLAAAMLRAERLSTTLRFEATTNRLDATSRAQLQELAAALEAGLYDGQEVVLVGFTGGEGAAELNRQAGLRRAQAVRAALVELAPAMDRDAVSVVADSFGEMMPAACDDAFGKGLNRRVEVWLRPAQR